MHQSQMDLDYDRVVAWFSGGGISEVEQVQYLTECGVYPSHVGSRQVQERTCGKASVVDSPKLVEEQVGITMQIARGENAQAQGFSVIHQLCSEGHNEGRGMIGIQQGLALDDQYRSGLAWLRTPAGI